MRQVLFKWRGTTVWSYPAMLYLGLLVGVYAGTIAAREAALNVLHVYIAIMILILPALAGARLLYVATEWRVYSQAPKRIWDRNDGGYIMYGGLPAALLVSVPLLAILHLKLPTFWDIAIFTILIGMFFTRIGCLLNGCCAGRPTNSCLGINLPNRNGVWEKRFPTQVFEAGLAAGLLLFAVSIRHSVRFPGALFLAVSLGYALGRVVIEFARERTRRVGFSLAHSVSLVLALLSLVCLTIYRNG